MKIGRKISRENKRKPEISRGFCLINKNVVDRKGKMCYKYICSPGTIVPDFEQKYKTSFDNEKAGEASCSFVIEGREKKENTAMSTFMANKGNIVRKWYVVDAAGKPTYTPHADCGDNVIVINASKATLSGKKLEQKMYRTHSGWVGGLKETKYRLLMQQRPELAVRLAVRGMMPRNTVTKDSLTRLKIYRGDSHPHAAQKPENWVVE